MLGWIRGTLEEGRGRTAEGFRDLDDLCAMCCSRWPCAGIVAAVCREASRLRCKSIGIRVSGLVVTHKPFATAVYCSQQKLDGSTLYKDVSSTGSQSLQGFPSMAVSLTCF